jgi:hypothetical protein
MYYGTEHIQDKNDSGHDKCGGRQVASLLERMHRSRGVADRAHKLLELLIREFYCMYCFSVVAIQHLKR